MSLRIDHPDLPAAFDVAGGEAVLVEGGIAPVVVGALVGGWRRPARVTLDGRALPARSLAARVHRGLGVVSGAPVAADVSVRDHLAALGPGRTVDPLLAEAPLLAGRGADPAGVLSGGERRVLAWLRTMALRPRAVLLDRAGEGLDTTTLAWAGGVVAAWTAEGVAVLVRPGRSEERTWVVKMGG